MVHIHRTNERIVRLLEAMAQLDRRQEVLAAARNLFARYGYRKTTLDDVAAAVGMRKSSLYHYYENKDELFRAAARQMYQEQCESFDSILSRKGSVRARLSALLNLIHDRIEEFRPILRKLRGELDEFHGLIRADSEEFFERQVNLVTRILEEGVERGELRPLPARMLALSLLLLFRVSFENCLQFSGCAEVCDNQDAVLSVFLDPYTVGR